MQTTEWFLNRDLLLPTASLGTIVLPNGGKVIQTLEDKVREIDGVPVEQWKVPHTTAIGRGRYKLVLDMSTRFKKIMPHLLDVRGYTGIRMHPGCFDKDTDGCILVGMARGASRLISSQICYETVLMPAIEQALSVGDLYLTVR